MLDESFPASNNPSAQFQLNLTKKGTFCFMLQINGITEKQTVIHP